MAHVNSITLISGDWQNAGADLFAVGLFEGGSLSPRGKSADESVGGQIGNAIINGDLKGKAGESAIFYGESSRILVVGLGKKKDFNAEAIRSAGGAAAKAAISGKWNHVLVESFGEDKTKYGGQALAEGLILGSYQFLDYHTTDKEQFELSNISVIGGNKGGIEKGTVVANAVCLARNLENHPGNVSTPTKLAETAAAIAKEGGMKLTVLDREEFTEMGMGGLAGVASGTDEPPKFIVLEYMKGKKSQKPKIVVGKGITFDSGGISIKPASKMDEMKFDMCGAASVLGIMKTIAGLKPKMNAVGIIAATENLSGGKAYKPGDILTAYNGKTIEVLNTDAEGRNVLSDALSYASKHYDPAFILDFATLTGAVLVALGHEATGVMGTNPKLMERVKKSSEKTGEKVWELPLWDEFCEHVKSDIADVKNIGKPMQAGTIAGAAFLKEFVGEGIPWVHFDIAGTAWGDRKRSYFYKQSATGEIIRLALDVMGA